MLALRPACAERVDTVHFDFPFDRTLPARAMMLKAITMRVYLFLPLD